MPIAASDLNSDDLLKRHIESEIQQADDLEVSLEVAAEMLGIPDIDKAYDLLKQRSVSEHFTYQEGKARHGLRPYQEAALESLESLLAENAATVAVQLPTGAGKTFLIHSFIHHNYLKKNQNVLIITPSWEIANQHAATICQQFKDGQQRVRRLGGRGQLISVFDEYTPAAKGKVIITTSALFFARQKALGETLKAALVVIDEGHHGWKKKRLNSVQTFARGRAVSVVLLTATPPVNMGHLPFAAQLKYLDLVPDYLVKCQVVRLDTGETFDPVLKNGLLTQASRIEISTRQTRFAKIVDDSIAHLQGQTIYYAGSVKEAMGVVAEYQRHGLSAVVVHSKWSEQGSKINALAIDKFRSGQAQVLVNVQMLAMGFDVPTVQTIIVARPVESDTLFTQMVGRGARPAEGKDKFILIDVHDTISKPEVAKIFEHRELFYSGTVELEELAELPVDEGRRILLPLLPRAKVPQDEIPFEFKRSKVVVAYFLEPYQLAA